MNYAYVYIATRRKNAIVSATFAKANPPQKSSNPRADCRSAPLVPFIGMLAHRPTIEVGQPIGPSTHSTPERSALSGYVRKTLSVEVSL
jgi:hypothetical protein